MGDYDRSAPASVTLSIRVNNDHPAMIRHLAEQGDTTPNRCGGACCCQRLRPGCCATDPPRPNPPPKTAAPWLASSWELDTRYYYELHLRQDLFGDRVLSHVWGGGRGSALEQIRHELCENYAEGVARQAGAEKFRV